MLKTLNMGIVADTHLYFGICGGGGGVVGFQESGSSDLHKMKGSFRFTLCRTLKVDCLCQCAK